jgi:hypothetical protein
MLYLKRKKKIKIYHSLNDLGAVRLILIGRIE